MIVLAPRTRPIVAKTRGGLGPAGDDGAAGPAGDVARAANRTALAAIAAAAGMTRHLTEAGREGMFVFDSSDLSARVTADTAQGIYVPPVSDADGSSGAWVRKFDGAVSVKWFGAVGDDVTNDGAAFLAAIAALASLAVATGYGYGKGTKTLFVPAGTYYLGANTLDIYTAMTLRGEGFGENGGIASLLRWAPATTGIRVQEANTLAAAGTRVADGRTGAGTVIERLALQSTFSGTESEAHGIHLRTRATIKECWVANFDGDGLHVYCSAGSGGATEGNCNNLFVQRCTFGGCRDGVFIQGADSNAGTLIMVDALYNRRWGIWDNSFLGNGHFGHHTSSNGIINVGAGIPYTLVSHGGKHYSVIVGQEAGAAVNAPSGTTADNAYWYYVRGGGVGAYSPAWVSGVSVRAGGPYFASTSEYTSCYSEADQAVAQLIGNGSNGGTPGQYSGAKGTGKIETRYPGGFGLSSGMRITGNNPAFNGPAALEFYMLGAVATINAYDRDAAAFYPMDIDALWTDLKASGAIIGTISSAGLTMAAGKAVLIPDEAYGAPWNGKLEAPTKNAVYDAVETVLDYVDAADQYTVVTKIAGYTETAISGEMVILADLAAGFTIVLPTAVGNKAKIIVKKIQAAGTITLDGAGSETIDGSATVALTGANDAITLVSDNANWQVI